MQIINNDVWISFGPGDNDTLRPATINAGGGEPCVFAIGDDQRPSVEIADAMDVLVFFDGPGGFMQQSARIVAIHAEPEPPVFGFETMGDAVSAENREMFRVGVSLSDHHAVIEGAYRKMADISSLGFAFFASESYAIGDVLEASVSVDHESYSGRCRVQSIKQTPNGHRYGVLCVGAADADLEKGLGRLTMEAQRAQLRRLSRAG